jgi:hypothetical protein
MYKGGRPILDTDVLKILEYINYGNTDIITSYFDLNDYYAIYRNWIDSSKNNIVIGLDNFTQCDYINGTTQAFDHFYIKHRDKKFKFLAGEYKYHKFVNNDSIIHSSIDLDRGDALIISLPFGATATTYMYDSILTACENLNIPVLVDCAYFGICNNIHFNLCYTCIEQVAFSLSRTFPVGNLRIGIRFSKNEMDGIHLDNVDNCVNKVGAYVGKKLMNTFSPDFIYNKYKDKQAEICSDLGLIHTSFVIFALGGKDFEYLSRDGFYRLCLSEELVK